MVIQTQLLYQTLMYVYMFSIDSVCMYSKLRYVYMYLCLYVCILYSVVVYVWRKSHFAYRSHAT